MDDWIDLQIKRSLGSKYRWSKNKRSPLKEFDRLTKMLGYCLFGKQHTFPYGANLISLGVDEFGHNVGAGTQLYLKLVRSRGASVRSLVVLGSRA
jgi:ribosomal protein S18 acetylase RimI-like enzyme